MILIYSSFARYLENVVIAFTGHTVLIQYWLQKEFPALQNKSILENVEKSSKRFYKNNEEKWYTFNYFY